ncbi:hypothetical protein LR48_Vigan09g047800 [Vigna angularis]|uniref:Uncharacterized protein n=1 Tax=Phaseolus angularis TaxID=3914 RepID=A0A0L9VAY6_PHAAN|nr:hypothetical protein LR48_Vigan09g047800 [Vigna angularis]
MIQQGRPKQLVDQLSPHRCREWHNDQTSDCLRLMPSLGGDPKSRKGWPAHRARDSRLQYSKGRRRSQINPIPASSFPVSMSKTSSLSKIAWQEKQTQASRAGGVEAPTVEEEDEDDDFEVAEEGEEGDSDDSMS